MPAATIQFVFKPNPGADLRELKGLIAEGAAIWRAQGAQVSLWGVQVGEVGNMVFVARFDSHTKMGEALEAINNDATFAQWRAKNLKSGLASWVRSNHAYEIPV